MTDNDPASQGADFGLGKTGKARESAFTAETTPQSPINEPDPFNELENLYAENAGLKDKVLRTLAEMENIRRRADREMAEAKTYAISAFAREMLTFADNLSRALENLPAELRTDSSASVKSFIEGVELIEKDFVSLLNRRGVIQLEPLGQKFDPNFHEALFEVPDTTTPSGTVVKVVEAGYRIGDRVLRPAKVGVSRGGPKQDASSAT